MAYHSGCNAGHSDGVQKSRINANGLSIKIEQHVGGHSFPELTDNVKLMTNAPSMHDALWAIANMQVKEDTNIKATLALCMSIARLELEKLNYVLGWDKAKTS